jgi:hypothetical protein
MRMLAYLGLAVFFLGACGKETVVTLEEFSNDLKAISSPATSDSEAESIAQKYRGDFKIVHDGKSVSKAEFEEKSRTKFDKVLEAAHKARKTLRLKAK